MSDENKIKLISIGKTFATTFIVSCAVIIANSETITWTMAFWGSVITAGLRAGLTEIIKPYIPIKLGGSKR